MKCVYFSNGIFETTLTVNRPDVEEVETNHRFFAHIARLSFEMRKTSYCKMKYEIEPSDKDRLYQLKAEAEKAARDLVDGLTTPARCRFICDRYNEFSKLYYKATSNKIENCDNVKYIEIADETNLPCHAVYILEIEGIEVQEVAFKIGEPFKQDVII